MINVSVGIPAHNEERNINLLLNSVLKQSCENFILKEIIIVLDGCTDNTSLEVKKIDNKKIKLINDSTRFGKATRLNQIYSMFSGDILIQLDADVKIKDVNLFSKIVEAFRNDKDLSVFYGMQRPLTPISFVGRLAHFGFDSWEVVKRVSNKNVERYNCFACLTAYSKIFLKKYKLNENSYVTDDTYSFYFAKKYGFKTLFEPTAKVYFTLPSTLHDYSYQMSRYLSTENEMKDTFGDELVSKYETINTLDRLKGLLKNITIFNIHIVICYIFLQLVPKVQILTSSQKRKWVVIESSK